MKSKEEIEKLAEKYADGDSMEEAYTSYIAFQDGYTQSQEDMAVKKYTKEDLENAFNSGRGYGVPDNIKDFNSFINSLNKQD